MPFLCAFSRCSSWQRNIKAQLIYQVKNWKKIKKFDIIKLFNLNQIQTKTGKNGLDSKAKQTRFRSVPSLSVCVFCISRYVCVCVHVCERVYVSISICVRMVCIYNYKCVWVLVYMCVSACVSVYQNVCFSKVVFLHMPQTHLECLIFFCHRPILARWGSPRGAGGPRGAARPLPFWSS